MFQNFKNSRCSAAFLSAAFCIAASSVLILSCSSAPTAEFSRGRLKMPEGSGGDLELEPVLFLRGPMPTGIAVSKSGRVFVNFPRWGDRVKFTVAEIREKDVRAYPNQLFNVGDSAKPESSLFSVQSVVVDESDRLWLLDTGSTNFEPVKPLAAKLVGVNLELNKPFQTIAFPENVVLPTSYLNDVRFDLSRGKAGIAYITDSSDRGPNGIVVVDLASGKSWRRLHDHPSTKAEPKFVAQVEGKPLMVHPNDDAPQSLRIGSDGVAVSKKAGVLYYSALAGRHLYSVSLDALSNPDLSDAQVARTVVDLGDRGFASDGLASDSEGRLFLTDYENNAIRERGPKGSYSFVAMSPHLLWPDSMALSTDGYLYFTVNQLHRQARFQGGFDRREQPYAVYRIKVEG